MYFAAIFDTLSGMRRIESMQQQSVWIVVTLLVLAIAIVSTFAFHERPEVVELQDLQFSNGSPMIALQGYVQQDERGVLLLNLATGEEQFFPGQWEVFLSATHTAYIKGEWPRTSDRAQTEPGEQLYEVRHGRSITRLQVAEFIGHMQWIEENLKQTYVLIAVKRGDRVSYCVQARDELVQDAPVCDYFQAPEGTRAVWNPSKDHEAVFLSPAGELFVMDPFEATVGQVSATDEPDRFASLLALFEQQGIQDRVPLLFTATHRLVRAREGVRIQERTDQGRWVQTTLFAGRSLRDVDFSWRHEDGQRWLCAESPHAVVTREGCGR